MFQKNRITIIMNSFYFIIYQFSIIRIFYFCIFCIFYTFGVFIIILFCTVASGRSIFPEERAGAGGANAAPPGQPGMPPHPPGGGADDRVVKCKCCRHRMYVQEVRKYRNCPLCHARLEAGYNAGVR